LSLRETSIHALLAAAALALAACDRVPRNAIESCTTDVRMAPAMTDILVVVDDSTSMTDEQRNLRQNLAAFVQALAASPIPHDFQIGVTTTSVDPTYGRPAEYPYWEPPFNGQVVPYPAGRLVAIDPGALTDPALEGKLLWDRPSGRFVGTRLLPTGSATLVDDFEANVLVGVLGSDKEEPLRAAQLALTTRIADGTNAGFLRPGARLGIIILTDEDDCSEDVAVASQVGTTNDLCHSATIKAQLESLDGLVGFLQGPIDGELRDPVLAVIAAFDPVTLQPVRCADTYDDPTRLAALLDTLGPAHAFRGSICDPSFGPSLQHIADLLVPQTVPLEGAPSDARMLVASVLRGGATLRCPVAPAGDPAASEAGAVYAPPQGGRPATLTFQGQCQLQAGDQVKLAVICAG
jgi:hypothetical protein